jgi:hypothetical protein
MLMTFKDTWNAVVKANPLLMGKRVTMTPANFKKVMSYVFDQGVSSGKGGDLFGKMFGGDR